MKIAYIAHAFPPNGFAAAINTYRIVKGLAERGHELNVFCSQTVSKYGSQFEPLQGNTLSSFKVNYSLPTPIPLSITIPHLINAFRALNLKFDLLITQFHLWHLATLSGFFLKTCKGKPMIIRVHDMIPDSSLSTQISKYALPNSAYRVFLSAGYGVFLKNLGKKADKVFVLTNSLRNLLLENGYPQEKVTVIPNGVDTATFSPTKSENRSLEKTILYVGSMMPEDGLSSLVKAFALLQPNKDLNLMLIGDGPERLQLIELVKKLNLEEKVKFHKYVPHKLIHKFINDAYITVGPLCASPINNFTIPTKILEYFACEKPVVSSPLSEDILIDGFTGYALKEITPKNIAEKFTILFEDEKLVAELGRNARQLVLEKFEWERVIDRIEKEIQDFEPHRFD